VTAPELAYGLYGLLGRAARALPLLPAMSSRGYEDDIMSFPDPSDFDYTAYLQPDAGFADGVQGYSTATLSESSGGMHTPPYASSRSLPSSSSINNSSLELSLHRTPMQQRQRLERRGHTKSRRGCYNCKRRRIKVQYSSSRSRVVE
jgi:hypothetical protein